MTSQLHKLIAICMVTGAIVPAAFADGITVPPVPPQLQVPSGNAVYLKGSAVGTQNYVCLPSSAPSGYSWTFLGPQATLFFVFKWLNGEVRQQIMTHYLSPNPNEDETPRATWQSSLDTSAIWARAIANSADPNFVAPGAIPWLLLQIVGNQNGPTGGSSLNATTFIQRVKTSGGTATAAGCSQSSNIGAVTLVPYTTDYYFYKAAN